MDKVVKKKVSEAVKKKLEDLQGFVANELPEYIMVMVANRKTKSQIEEELRVFLGHDSGEFATWLVNLLEDSKCFLDEDKKSKIKIKKERVEVDDILASDTQAINDLISKDESELPLQFETAPEIVPGKVHEVPIEDLKPDLVEQKSKPKNVLVKKVKDEPKRNSQNTTKTSEINSKKVNNEPALYEPAIARDVENGGEYDPLYPSFNTLSSLVYVSERKSSVPRNMQANKLLLIKAIDDANASVCGKDINHVYKPTPIKVLANHRKKIGNIYPKNTNSKDQKSNSMEMEDYDNNEAVWCEETLVKPYPNLLYPPIVETNSAKEQVVHQREVLIANSLDEVAELRLVASDDDDDDINQMQVEEMHSTQFVVTLNGVPKTLKRTYSDSLSEKSVLDTSDSREIAETNDVPKLPENMEEDEECKPSSKKQKLFEKCRYWPACRNSENCDYHHPSVLCKTFPNCKYGDKCLYIHPNCKFDSRCSRKDCPYTHVSKREFPQMKMGSSFHVQARKVKSVMPPPPLCKFYPNCSIYHCPFLHPNKKCRFGADCNTSNCLYFHQNFPPRKQLKWSALS